MRYIFSILIFLISPSLIKAQNGDSIITRLQSINLTITNQPCNSDKAAAISNRAMNIFLSDKTGYLNTKSDLSFFTNYVTFNTSESRLTVNHNFQKATGADDPIKRLLSIGLSITIPNNYALGFLDNRHETGLGIIGGYKWLGKVKTRFTDCSVKQNKATQKQTMDALRAGILNAVAAEIYNKEADFKTSLNEIIAENVQGFSSDSVKAIIERNFYEELNERSEEKFATLQAETLTKSMNFKLISTHWTAIQCYVPVVFSKYNVAPSLTEAFQQVKSYPFELTLNHTRLWESSRKGRFFATLGGGIFFNNSKLSYSLDKINYADYKIIGGTDTQHDEALKNDKAYLGDYENFITPSVQYRMVYFPVEYHLGISILVQQNFGIYNFLNTRIGIPVVLINSKKTPSVNFEFYVSLTDLTNNAGPSNNLVNKTMAGLSVGIPLSRLMY
jgi:sulfur relay (sulfurtransferase) DsrC/TusE family protein